MSSVNKVILVGRLGKAPEIREVNDTKVVNFSIATSKSWKDKSGEKKEDTQWHRIVAWGRTAEVAAEYLDKGSLVYIEGELQTRKYTDKEDIERYTTEIRVGLLRMLGGKSNGGDSKNASTLTAPVPSESIPADSAGGDDIPF